MTVRDVFKISICCGTAVLASFRSIEVIISDEVLIWPQLFKRWIALSTG